MNSKVNAIIVIEKIWDLKFKAFLIVAIALILGLITTFFIKTPMYESTASILIVENAVNGTELNDSIIATYNELIKTNEFLNGSIDVNELQDVNIEELKNNISIEQIDHSQMIKLSVKTTSVKDSYNIANQISKSFIDKIIVEKFEQKATIEEAPIQAGHAYNISHRKDMLLFGIIGITIALIFIVFKVMFDTKIKTEEEIQEYFKIPVLSSFAENKFTRGMGGKK